MEEVLQDKEIYQSNSMDNEYNNSLDMDEDHMGISKVNQYTCPVCGIVKPTKLRLDKHIQAVHIGLKAQFECDICKWKSKTKSALYSHMKSLHMEKSFHSCEYCDAQYKSISGLKYHIIQYHSTDTTMQKCHLCDFETKQEFLLRRHIKRHSDDRPYICEKCNQAFGSLDILKSHYIVHTNDRPFICLQCPKTYKTKAKLRAHISQIHQGNRVQCPCCDFNGTSTQVLRRHIMKFHEEFDLPPPGTVMKETAIMLPPRILTVNRR
uniref:CSON003046 protein n=1 Tax=Culicoides sonorensis TaxID=179676 RepID=A0A336MKI2_CULSO